MMEVSLRFRVAKDLTRVVAKAKKQHKGNASLRRHQAFMKKMERQNLVQRQGYTLPMADTVGRHLVSRSE